MCVGFNVVSLAMEDSWDSGRGSRVGKPVFSPATREERAAKNLVYEQLKSEAMALGLPTDGGIGAIKNRIREFKSIEDSKVGGPTWRAGRPPIEHARGAFHGMCTEDRKASRGGSGGRFVALEHEGRTARAEERRQKSLEYAFKIGCDLDGDESEAEIQKAIETYKEGRKAAAVKREERYIDGLKSEARKLGIEVYDWSTKDSLKREIASKKKEEWEKHTREAAKREGISGLSYRSPEDLAEELGGIRDERRARRDEERSTRAQAKYAEQVRRKKEYELYEAEERRKDPHYDRKKEEREAARWASYLQHLDSACMSGGHPC